MNDDVRETRHLNKPENTSVCFQFYKTLLSRFQQFFQPLFSLMENGCENFNYILIKISFSMKVSFPLWKEARANKRKLFRVNEISIKQFSNLQACNFTVIHGF